MKKIALITAAAAMTASAVMALRLWMRRGTLKTRQITVSKGDQEKTHYYATGANGEKVMSWAVRTVIHLVSDLG